ncbi:glycosyltransferase family 2 protein [Methanosphaera sp. WGK6]|uniref:glycosyltransferase family 2 protein n=1 Tax=Methanosphaera sp. WGK6 TaxID=1561964 RepID=UPI00084BCFCF|nr:glycosyltransferase family 2 protein [Methanosphaera sp. WGK6]OED29494.1 hypothetical protein NL43_07980 [Methanosphaera sp. WGK6]
MNNYKVSIIIPCYNIESNNYTLFQEMFQSLIKQTFNNMNMEIIMVDDKSPDNTRKILQNLEKQYSNIKLILLDENNGASNARNQAIKQATSDYIMFLDADDKYCPDFVETAYNTIKKYDIDFLLSNYIIYMNNTLTKFDTGFNKQIITNNKKDELQYATKFFWTGIYNKSFLIENNIIFPKIGHGDDSLFLSKCICCTKKDIILLNDYYSVIYTADNGKSITHTFTKSQLEDLINAYTHIIDSYQEYDLNKVFIQSQLKLYILVLMTVVIRSTEDYNTQKIMVNQVSQVISMYDYNYQLTFYWRIIHSLILNKQYILLYIVSKLIKSIFEQKWFIKHFRNKE